MVSSVSFLLRLFHNPNIVFRQAVQRKGDPVALPIERGDPAARQSLRHQFCQIKNR